MHSAIFLLIKSKRYTPPIERNNGRQRHWLAQFRRRSIVVSKSLEMLECTMALFARFRVNGSIDELIALLKCNFRKNLILSKKSID
ncbi:MAG: IS1 family transposase [Alphaproteobacteria bacterium]|nr:IS1 family transposase [Alphaproteobacteria bacterium]